MSKIRIQCEVCDKPFFCFPSAIMRGRKFCSKKCAYKGYEMCQDGINRARDRRIKWNKEHPISTEQARKNALKLPRYKGKDHPNWKGGIRKKSDGRIMILHPGHPFADDKGYVVRSHVAMENKIGRYVLPKEVVHHINGNKVDDRPENLRLFLNRGDHTSLHHKQGDIRTKVS